MKATLRYFIILAVCLIPLTIPDLVQIKERFLVELGIFLGVTAAYWTGYAIIQKKQKGQQSDTDQPSK